jgi:hypothetical protein
MTVHDNSNVTLKYGWQESSDFGISLICPGRGKALDKPE